MNHDKSDTVVGTVLGTLLILLILAGIGSCINDSGYAEGIRDMEQRAIDLKIAEHYITVQGRKEFRFLTENELLNSLGY